MHFTWISTLAFKKLNKRCYDSFLMYFHLPYLALSKLLLFVTILPLIYREAYTPRINSHNPYF